MNADRQLDKRQGAATLRSPLHRRLRATGERLAVAGVVGLSRVRTMADERVKRAEFYERKALEARAKAETIKDWDARRTMLLVASMWEALARTAKGERSG